MMRVILTCLCIAAGTAAGAQTVTVRSAEHSGFTRIVVDFPERPAWRLGRSGDAYELRTGEADLRYDLSDIYRRLYSGRLVRIDPAAAGDLRIELGCDCSLSTEELPNGGLVIDVRDSAPIAGDRYEISLDAPIQPAPPVLPATTLPVDLMPDLLAPITLPAEADPVVRVAAESTGRELEDQIRRGIELDLVDPAPGALESDPAQQDDPPRDLAIETADESLPQRTNIRIRTEAEMAVEGASTLAPSSVDPGTCAQFERLLDPNGWVDPGTGPAGIAVDRVTLVGARGVPDPAGFRDLALAYLYLTFGREAESVLAIAPDDFQRLPLYLALARLVDGRPLDTNPLAGLTACPGHTGLWARLATPDAPAVRSESDAGGAFASWPDHMRRTLGSTLAMAFLDAGEIETARAVHLATARIADPEDSRLHLIARRLAAADGDARPAAELRDLAESRRPESAQALIEVIEARIDEDVPVGADLAMQAGSLAFEMAETEAASALRTAEIRALIHDGLWRIAAARIDAEDRSPAAAALDTELAQAITESGEDADLLWVATRLSGRRDVGRQARRVMAERIVRLGLPDMARNALDLGIALPEPAERRILARIAILEERPDVAEGYLAGLDTAEDHALREALSALRTRLEVAAADANDQPEQTASSPEPSAAPPVPANSLAASRSLLTTSESLRDEIQALLQGGPS